MEETKTYENFPVWMPLLSNLHILLIYAAGVWILSYVGTGLAAAYLVFAVAVEVRVMKKSCVNCYYYGRDCGMGKGKLCAMLFKQGDQAKFGSTPISWTDLIPDFLVPVFPFVAGAVLLVRGFSLTIAGLMLALLLLATIGTGAVRSGYACRYCRQRECGCPAEQLFSRK